MRKCKTCNSEYEEYGQRHLVCRQCKREYDREWHNNRSPEQKQRKLDLQKKRGQDNVDWVRNIKEASGCVDCGNVDVRVLEFDHLPEYEKDFNIADISRNGYSQVRIQEEIDKCEIVCANCHRIRTHERRQN